MLFRHEQFHINQRWLLLLVCLLGAGLIWGVMNIRSATAPILSVGKGVEYLQDAQQRFSHSDILTLQASHFQIEQTGLLSYGMTDAPYWFRFELPQQSNQRGYVLEIDYAMLDDVKLWFYRGEQLISQFHQGDALAFNERPIAHEKFLFPIPPSREPITVVIRSQTSGTLRLPIHIWDRETYLVHNGEHSIVMGLFFGFMGAMALSNLFFFITTKNTTFLSYCGYVIFLALTLAGLHGLGYKYLWPDSQWLQAKGIGIFASATILFAMIFSSQLLNMKDHSRLLYRLLRYSAMVFAAAVLTAIVIPYAVFIKLYLVLLFFGVVIIYGAGVVLWRKGVQLARFYTLAWTALLFSGFIASLDNADLIDVETPSHYLLMFGATIETFLLALALALSYSQQRAVLFDTQEKALVKEREARKAQDEVLKIREQAQEELEYKVQERTLELEIALRELSETNRELEQKNTIDSLSGLRNRQYFDKKYLAEVRRSRREQTPLSVVMIDIDHFKSVNDRYGHLVGDECLRAVSEELRAVIKRPSDDACRYGGEEFALVLPNTARDGAELLVAKLCTSIAEKRIATPAGELNVTVSAGICTAVVASMQDEKNLLATADRALYQAKQAGRNQYRFCVINTHQEDSLNT